MIRNSSCVGIALCIVFFYSYDYEKNCRSFGSLHSTNGTVLLYIRYQYCPEALTHIGDEIEWKKIVAWSARHIAHIFCVRSQVFVIGTDVTAA